MNELNLKAAELANTALILVDIQQGFDDTAHWGGARNNPKAEEVCKILLLRWRESNRPIFHVQHCSTDTGSPLAPSNGGNQFKVLCQPAMGEAVIKKKVNSAFIGTNLKELLIIKGIQRLIFVGLTTDHCISTSVRMAGNFGFEVYVVSDATATFDKVGFNGEQYKAALIHETALASLHNEFATVINAEDFL